MKQIQKGFTLIELMIVVAIIGILAAVAIPAYQDYIVKAKLTKIQSTMDSVKIALAMYYQENGSFPQGTAAAVTNPVGGGGTAGTADAGPDIWTSIGLSSFPVLPPEVSNMLYIGDNVGDTFSLVLTVAPNKVKTTIDGTLIAISPTSGNTTSSVVAPAAAKPIGTAIVWEYACTSADVVLTKYFNNAGVPCTATTP